MRIVIDTNVLISAALKPDTAPRQTIRWVQGHGHHLIKSHATEDELIRTLGKPKLAALLGDGGFISELAKLMSEVELVHGVEQIQACRDREDNKFLELAINGRADVLVSGDNDLLIMHPFRKIPILTPSAFLAWADRYDTQKDTP